MLTSLIYEYFRKENEARQVRDEVTFAPSYFIDCRRKIYYKKTGENPSNPITLPALLKMELGKAAHLKIQNILTDIGIYKAGEEHKEIKFQGLKFNYYIDGLLEVNGKKMLMEIKTVYASGFYSIENAPKKEHAAQLYLYMLFENMETGVLLYVRRDNGRIVEHVITMNGPEQAERDKWIENRCGMLRELKRMIEAKQIPTRDFNVAIKDGEIKNRGYFLNKEKISGDWQCSYCQYRDHCWADVLTKQKEGCWLGEKCLGGNKCLK